MVIDLNLYFCDVKLLVSQKKAFQNEGNEGCLIDQMALLMTAFDSFGEGCFIVCISKNNLLKGNFIQMPINQK